MKSEPIPETLRRFMETDPWMVLMTATVLTAEQWQRIVVQLAVADLHGQVLTQVRKALKPYPTWFARKWELDVTNEVMIKLSEGRFWKRYDPARKLPSAYMIGCAFQYARTLTRSYWRRFGRDAA